MAILNTDKKGAIEATPKDGERKDGFKKGCNCHGFTFAQGGYEIDNPQVLKILADNYKKVAKSDVHVCCIVVYRVKSTPPNPDVIAHSALIVEADAAGAKTAWGKEGTKQDIGENSPPESYTQGAIPPMETEYYERDTTDQLDAATQAALKQAEDDYKQIPEKDRSTKAAKEKAAKLCQLKNTLIGVVL